MPCSACIAAKQTNLKLNSRYQQLSGYLQFAFALLVQLFVYASPIGLGSLLPLGLTLFLFPIALPDRAGFVGERGDWGSAESRDLHHQRLVWHQAWDRERHQDGQEDRRVGDGAAWQGKPLEKDRCPQERLQRHRKWGNFMVAQWLLFLWHLIWQLYHQKLFFLKTFVLNGISTKKYWSNVRS